MLIDDRLAIESSRPRARLLSEALILIMVSLGVVLNVPDPSGKKAQWLPKRSYLCSHHTYARNRTFSRKEA